MLAHTNFTIIALFAALISSGCGDSSRSHLGAPAPVSNNSPEIPSKADSATEKVPAGPLNTTMTLRLDDDGNQFTISNLIDKPLDDLTITTYPPPLTGNILSLPHAFKKTVGHVAENATLTMSREEFTNSKGALLSDSKRKVGAILINGKVGETPQGVMFTNQGGNWTISPPDVKWAAMDEPVLGPVDEPLRGVLQVELLTGEGTPYIIMNKEPQAIQDFEIRAFGPPRTGNALTLRGSFFKSLGRIDKAATIIVDRSEMKSDEGQPLSNSQMVVSVIRLSGKVNGEVKEAFRDLTEKKPE